MSIRLTAQQRIVAWRLATGRIITHSELAIALWGVDDERDLPLGNGIAVQVGRVRKLVGVPVQCMGYGAGWRVAPADLERFRDIIADEIERNVIVVCGGSAASSAQCSPATACEAAHG